MLLLVKTSLIFVAITIVLTRRMLFSLTIQNYKAAVVDFKSFLKTAVKIYTRNVLFREIMYSEVLKIDSTVWGSSKTIQFMLDWHYSFFSVEIS